MLVLDGLVLVVVVDVLDAAILRLGLDGVVFDGVAGGCC